ncbi:hypothetical protein CHUAL_004295 [Chamberlinius hualienensis]
MKFIVAAVFCQLLAVVLFLGSAESLSSGVSVSTKVETTFNELKLQKKYRYVVLVIRNEREIDVETVGLRHATYADFLRDIEVGGKAECRFGIFDLENVKCNSLFSMSWCPATAIVRQKVLYASSYLELKKSLQGLAGNVQATERSEASEEAVLKSNVCAVKTQH